jgi:hypothetical protein
MVEARIETKADEFLMRIRRETKMTLPEIEKTLKIPPDLLEEWIGIFEARGLLERVYPANPYEPPYVISTYGKKKGGA